MAGGRRTSSSYVGDKHFTVVPSDTVNFTDPDNASQPIDACIFVGGVGTVSLVDTVGRTVVYTVTNVPFVIPTRAKRVNTASTATLMVGIF